MAGPQQTESMTPRPTASKASSASSQAEQPKLVSRARQHLLEPVRASLFTEIELLILTFFTGIQDAISFPDYHCFASNQTGNTVFLAVALILPHLNGDVFYTTNVAVALTLFLAGGSLTGQVAHLVGARRRLWLVVCNALQTALVFAAAAIQLVHGVQPTGALSLGVIALLAFASGSQVVQSRSFACNEISTAMATAAWVDLLIDPGLLAAKNRPRNRRLAFLAVLVAGSLVGAAIYRTAGSAVALFVSAGGKAAVTGMFWFNGAEREKVEAAGHLEVV